MALPLLFGNYEFPPTDSDIWRTSQEWDLAWQWFYELGNDADAMNLRGRAAGGLLAVALGVLVWRWSQQLFGIGPRRAQRIIRYVAIIGIRQLAYDRWIRGRTMSLSARSRLASTTSLMMNRHSCTTGRASFFGSTQKSEAIFVSREIIRFRRIGGQQAFVLPIPSTNQLRRRCDSINLANCVPSNSQSFRGEGFRPRFSAASSYPRQGQSPRQRRWRVASLSLQMRTQHFSR